MHYSRGATGRDASPEPRRVTSFEQLCLAIWRDRVDATGAEAKGRQYICGPVGVAPRDAWHQRGTKALGVGKPHRCKRCVQPTAWLGLDVDAGLPSDWREALQLVLGDMDAFVYTTASHTEAKPRVRIVIALDRELPRAERIRASIAVRRRIDARLEEAWHSPLGWDASCDRPEQPLFLPPSNAQALRMRGAALVADRLLEEVPETAEVESDEDRAAGALEPTPGALAYLQTLVDRVRNAPDGERNNVLFGAAADAAKMDRLSDTLISEALEVAAVEAGLDPAEVAKTVQSGIDTGRDQPPVLAVEDEFEPVAPIKDDTRHEIRLRVGESADVVRRSEEALLAHRAPLYVRGDMLVRARPVTRAEALDDEDPIKRPEGALILSPVGVRDLQIDLEKAARYYNFAGGKGGPRWVRAAAPEKLAEMMLAYPGHRVLPPVRGVSQAPALRRDGSVATRPGYDARTALLLGLPAGWPEPPEPTREAAEAGLKRVRHLIRTFPFRAPADESVALAALLTGVLRPVLDAAPMLLFSAPTPGTGKSMLAHMVAVLATGQHARMLSWSVDPNENPKALTGALVAGDPVLVIDNLSAGLRSDFLCTMLTEPEMSLRMLGRTGQHRVPCRALVLGTGNNASVLGDLNRRVLVSTLDAGVERPELRQFANHPVEDALAGRVELVNALLTMARARILHGPARGPVWSSYGEWCWMVRDTLLWLGCTDPIEVVMGQVEEDPERQLLQDMLVGWRESVGLRPITAGGLLGHVINADWTANTATERLIDGLRAIGGGRLPDSKRLGDWLRKHKARPIDGLRFYADHDPVAKRTSWRVIEEF